MAGARKTSDIFVARETFVCALNGEQITVQAGVTRVRAGHPLVETYANYFEPADTDLHFDVEQATAAPGEKRGQGNA